MIVPGYMALYLTRPLDLGLTIGVAFATFAAVRALSLFAIVYGRRRTALMILFGYILGMMVRRLPGLEGVDYDVIGFIIPGLIALWMDRQGVMQTMASLIIVSVVARLILTLFVGTELLS